MKVIAACLFVLCLSSVGAWIWATQFDERISAQTRGVDGRSTAILSRGVPTASPMSASRANAGEHPAAAFEQTGTASFRNATTPNVPAAISPPVYDAFADDPTRPVSQTSNQTPAAIA